MLHTLAPKTRSSILSLVLAGLMACSSSPTDPTPPDEGGTGNTVGVAGGEIRSDDQKLTLRIPAGALGQATEITITRLEPSADKGDGPITVVGAYRFEPEGLELAEPATLTVDLSAELPAGKRTGESPVGLLAELHGETATLLDDHTNEIDVAGGRHVVWGSIRVFGTTGVVIDNEVAVEVAPPEEVAEGETFTVLAGAHYEPTASDTPVLYYDESLVPLEYLDAAGQEVARVDGGGDERINDMSRVSYVCHGQGKAAAEYRARLVLPEYARGLNAPEIGLNGLIEGALEFRFTATIECVAPEEPETTELNPPVSRPHSAHRGYDCDDDDCEDHRDKQAAPDFCEGVPPEECILVTGQGVQLLDARDGSVLSSPIWNSPSEYLDTVAVVAPAGSPGNDTLIAWGPQGLGITSWVDGGWGWTQLVFGQYTDVSSFDGNSSSGGVLLVNYQTQQVNAMVFGSEEHLDSSPGFTRWSFGGSLGMIISAFARTSDPSFPGNEVLVLTDAGQVYVANRIDASATLAATMSGGTRQVRALGEVAVVSNFDTSELTIFRWAADGTLTPTATVAVGDGPAGLDLMRIPNGNILIATHGYNDGTYSLVEVTPDGTLVDSMTADVPGECDQATFASLRNAGTVQVMVTCQDSGRIVLIDAQ